MNEASLLKLKQQIDSAKAESSELKGHYSALMKQLKDEWKVNSIEEAKKQLAKMETDINTLSDKIEKGINELEEKYNE